MKNTEQHRSIVEKFKENYRLYLAALVIVLIAEMIGMKKIQAGSALIIIYPMLFAIVISVLLGRDIFGFFKEKEAKKASSLVLVAITPFMAKIGVLAGSNLPKLAEIGPALAFQELGHVGTIFLALPIALLLGIKKEAIGAELTHENETLKKTPMLPGVRIRLEPGSLILPVFVFRYSNTYIDSQSLLL